MGGQGGGGSQLSSHIKLVDRGGRIFIFFFSAILGAIKFSKLNVFQKFPEGGVISDPKNLIVDFCIVNGHFGHKICHIFKENEDKDGSFQKKNRG